MILLNIKFKSRLPEEEVMRVAREREPQFRAIPGLIQKYYVRHTEPDHYGGVYVWDTRESLMAHRASELALSIPEAYGIEGNPEIEVSEIISPLRP